MELVAEQYKKSEVGLIPTDWDELTFKDICWVNQGLQIPISQRLILPNKNSKVYITIQYLNDGKTIEYIDDYVASVCCNKEDILMTRTGNTGIVVSGVEGVFHNNFFKINFDRDKFDKDYLVYYLNQSKTKKIILAKAGISTIPDLNHKDFYSIPIPLPPTKAEQTAIANALSDADALINGLEKLITKKRNIKQGAMQKLLQPKEGWEVKKLGELFKLSASNSKSSYLTDGGKYIVMDMGAVSSDGTILKSKRTNHKSDLLNFGDLVMPKDDIGGGNIIGKVGFIDQSNSYVLGDHVYKLGIITSNIDSLYFYFLINSVFVNKHFRAKASGSAQLGLGRKSVLEQELFFPHTKEEQTEIANILSDMDAEINALETKLEKYKRVKLGMMQNLLTGKIRLV
jgi:type I restriction enzyme S subunit